MPVNNLNEDASIIQSMKPPFLQQSVKNRISYVFHKKTPEDLKYIDLPQTTDLESDTLNTTQSSGSLIYAQTHQSSRRTR